MVRLDENTRAATDPVCGMEVAVATSEHRLECGQRTVYFCSAGCRTKFAADVESYAEGPRKDVAVAASGALYTCPMHPEIRRDGPGACPICGMALEPLVVTAEALPNHELTDMTRRLWVGFILALPVLTLEMGGHVALPDLHRLVPPSVATWSEFIFVTPVVLWAGWPFFERAWASVVRRSLNMFSLIARHRVRVSLQRNCDLRAGHFSGGLPRPGRNGRRLLRGRRRHHGSRVTGAGARAACA